VTERGSTQHSPRVDEELHKETESLLRGAPNESRAEEWRRMEPPAEGEPLPDTRPATEAIEQRSLLAISLRPSAFPADRARLLEVAAEEHAEDTVVEWLTSLPATGEYANVEQVWEALGGMPEVREHAPEPVVDEPVVAEPVVAEPVVAEPVVEEPVVEEPVVAEPPRTASPSDQPSPSIAQRICGLAVAGVELAVGITIEVVQQIRRRL
jgi:Protein of unknown function (DUF2795)